MQRGWIVTVMAYAALRAVVIGKTLGPHYGINPWHYFVVDFAAAGVEGWATGIAVGKLIDREKAEALPYLALAAAMFIVPDIYIFVVGDSLPWYVFAIIGCIVTTTGTITAVGIVRKVRSAWAERAAAGCATVVDRV